MMLDVLYLYLRPYLWDACNEDSDETLPVCSGSSAHSHLAHAICTKAMNWLKC